MPSTDSADSNDSTERENAPIDEYLKLVSPRQRRRLRALGDGLLHVVVMSWLPDSYDPSGSRSVSQIPFFVGAYVAALELFRGADDATSADD